jgi:hypothetical protein
VRVLAWFAICAAFSSVPPTGGGDQRGKGRGGGYRHELVYAFVSEGASVVTKDRQVLHGATSPVAGT